jgi:hypothetical protein
MVNNEGQLYTIEGIAAAILMVFTIYLVMSTTTLYTPGDSHISDMQLEQLGTDALRMMNTPMNSGTESLLQKIVENDDTDAFNATFLNYVNNMTGSKTDYLHYTANITYRNANEGNAIQDYRLAANRNLTGGEHPVRATEWVYAKSKKCGTDDHRDRAVLVEVLLWRD